VDGGVGVRGEERYTKRQVGVLRMAGMMLRRETEVMCDFVVVRCHFCVRCYLWGMGCVRIGVRKDNKLIGVWYDAPWLYSVCWRRVIFGSSLINSPKEESFSTDDLL